MAGMECENGNMNITQQRHGISNDIIINRTDMISLSDGFEEISDGVVRITSSQFLSILSQDIFDTLISL